MIDISWLRPGFLWGLSFSRIRFDEDYFITQLPNVDAKLLRHDVEYSLGAEFVSKSPKMDWGLKAVFSYRYNTYFIIENDKVNAMIQVFGRFNL